MVIQSKALPKRLLGLSVWVLAGAIMTMTTGCDDDPGQVPQLDAIPDLPIQTDASDTPPSDTPPSDTPPSDTPPSDTPTDGPTDTPPSDTPTDGPTDTPPSDTPMDGPTDTPPSDTPTDGPTDTPPSDTEDDGEVVVASCTAEFDACDPVAAAGTGFTCVDLGAGTGTCRIACDATADDCGAQVCITVGTDTTGFCAPSSCTSFFLNSDECGAGAGCFVVDGVGECYVAGLTPAGAACDINADCVVGSVCFGDACFIPECSADGTTKLCTGAGEFCDPFVLGTAPVDFGQCLVSCQPFVGGCAVGDFCVATEVNDTTGELEGVCIPSPGGTVALGGDCTNAPCADDLVCLDDGTGTGFCAQQCWSGAAEAAPAACGGTEFCLPLVDQNTGGAQLLGFCNDGCASFTAPSGCEAGEWCIPNTLDATVGSCIADDGTQGDGDSCGLNVSGCCSATGGPGCAADATIEACVCAQDSYCCDTNWDGQCAQQVVSFGCDTCAATDGCAAELFCIGNECMGVCDVGSSDPEPGSCDVAEGCGALEGVGGETLDLGTCQASCVFHGTPEACVDTNQVCAPGEAFGSGFDLCLDPPAFWPTSAGIGVGDTCPAGAGNGVPCRPDAVCFEATGAGPFICTELCHLSEGAFDTAGHPDCDGGGPTTCGQFAASFGLCE